MDAGLHARIRLHTCYAMSWINGSGFTSHIRDLGERFTSKSVREKLELFEASEIKLYTNIRSRVVQMLI